MEFDRNWSFMLYLIEGIFESWFELGFCWNDVYNIWKWVWEFYIYLYVIVFFVIGLYVGYYIIVNIYDGIEGKYFGLSLNIMVILFGFIRVFVMYFDLYY